MSVRLSEHLPLLASAPSGIQKLRGLVLELAVRGKLVPQDPSDEPASELLKRIAKERAKLEAEGKIKKSKTTPHDLSCWPLELPDSWAWCRFPDVASYCMGKTPPTKEAAYWVSNGIPWVSISDMSHGQRVVSTSRTVSNAARDKVFRSAPVPAGTLLMSFKLTVGKIATLGMDAFHNEAIISIFPFSGVSQEFLSHFLPIIAQGGNSKSALMGDTLNSESLALLAVPLPPIAEQHRIVAKVDELMALCDRLEQEVGAGETAHAKLVETLLGTLTQSTDTADLAANWQRLAEHFDTLFTTEASLDALKQTVLQLAVMGKLVPQDPSDEPASELLKRIAKERARLETEGKIKKSKATPLDAKDTAPFELPAGWVLYRLSDLTLVLNGRAYSKDELLSEGVPVLRVGNLFTSNHWYYSNLQLEDDKYCDQGDLLYSWSASFGPFIWQGPKVIYHYHIWKLRLFDESSLSKEYLYKFLLEKTAEIKAAGHGVSMIHMTKEKMEKILVPLPPLAEQHRIVAKVDELMALCNHLKADLAESRTRQDRLATTLIETALMAA